MFIFSLHYMSTAQKAFQAQKEYIVELGDQKLVFRTGLLGNQANATVVCQMGDTVCMSNCTVSLDPRAGVDFLPLQVVYQEKFYAGGAIAGSRFRKREGRPADAYILLGRMIDRGLRPMFPKNFYNDIQVFCTVLSYDFENEHDIASANAANLAVALSDMPADGPLGSVRVGLIGGELVLNPSREARKKSDLDMFVTASADRVVMIEAGGDEVPEEEILKAVQFGKKWAQKIARAFEGFAKEAGTPKRDLKKPIMHDDVFAYLKSWALPNITKAIKDPMPKLKRRRIFHDLMAEAPGKLCEAIENKHITVADDEVDILKAHAGVFVDTIVKEEVRRLVLEEGVRMSSRRIDEIRPVEVMLDILPNTVHGSALFQRGETQGLTTCTLGGPGQKLLIEGMEGEEEFRYFHHYNFPPFSVGETSNRLFVGNREVGHGNLAQRGIEPVLPDIESFPYTIRMVTEILESNGSSSMAATCGCTLALMAAGVPIRAPVAGIALGLISDEEKGKYVILSDLQDEEDFGGDMDFKVTGTRKGITAIQMDIKIKGLPDEVLAQMLDRAHAGRLHILDIMVSAISEPRKELSPKAPRIETIQINPEDIRIVIGKGGETIQKITKDLGVEIDIEDSGLIFVTAKNGEAMTKAREWIEGLTARPEVGKTYDCKVVRIVAGIGAIVEFLRGKDAMIHISELKWQRTENVEDVLKMGDQVKALCIEFDAVENRTRMSLKQLQERPAGFVDRPQGGHPSHGGGHRGAPRGGGYRR